MKQNTGAPLLILTPRKAMMWLVGIALVLAGLHLTTQAILAMYGYGIEGFWGQIIARFDLDAEVSLPTWYSQMLLFLAAVIAGYIAVAKCTKRHEFRYHWAALSGVLVYASIDEGASLHETLGFLELTRSLGIDSPFFRFGWVVAGFVIVGVLAAVFMRFWWQLPRRTRVLFAVAVSVFLLGSLGIEMASANYLAYAEWNSFVYRGLLVLLEEGMEISGILLLVYTLLDYIATDKLRVDVAILSDEHSA